MDGRARGRGIDANGSSLIWPPDRDKETGRAGPGRAHRRARNTCEGNGSSEDGGCGSGSGFTVATTVVAQMMGGPSFGAKFKGATAMTTKNDVGEMETMGSALICGMPAELRRNRRRHGVGAATKRRPRLLGPKFFLSSYSSFCMMETLAR